MGDTFLAYAPSGAVPNVSWSTLARVRSGGASPQGYGRFRPVAGSHEAAASHSSSVGSRFPAYRANASASYQVTWQTGCDGSTGPIRSMLRVVQRPSVKFQYLGARGPDSVRHCQPASDQCSRVSYPPAAMKTRKSWLLTG